MRDSATADHPSDLTPITTAAAQGMVGGDRSRILKNCLDPFSQVLSL